MKNSTLLRSRVEFQIKSFCFFHCLLDRGHFTCADAVFLFFPVNLSKNEHVCFLRAFLIVTPIAFSVPMQYNR